MAQQLIGFIGAGNMATSLAGGMVAKGIRPARIWMSDPSKDRLDEVAQLHRVHVSADNRDVLSRVDVLVLAVKPQMMQEVCENLRDLIADRQPLVISIAAGITVANLKSWLGETPVVRSMPNTPSLVQAGATGLFAAAGVSDEQKAMAKEILGSVGLTFWFDEEKELDAVTAVSGSGPAYFFLLMESLIEAGKAQGLDAATARQMVLQTAWGAAQLAITSEVGPDALRQQVTSPGGTTAAALNVFEEAGFREQVQAAVAAARERSEELAG
ncbi:MAG: pyrroline-5-carboxylate reductase [Alcanivoracaceae bacterium]|uniref:pyrroline-5-carboxylate reductase n=1 Tax=Alcanivorax sp. MD8A TaxID=1177157 RepID=UPI000C662DEC|nr:pyrroline-5-carboxylate reductase [Alcanivorax sp. MD8A]MAX56407.1 pyrroline-5-carboxylate reductase [Alcanivoracaceae bacterium]MCG8438322.1 pyrroline-5-carboxylate reductase [Pseudomonadales bacterium]MEE2871204.1 pyrroline-5-carboxylate reductase [Pseudomonadota bacterium]PNE04030.1 pyrroline-5-carboxylate reductase [Alcanivorax sp. MD8A]|tara:strand:- start:2769 stop:3578 length:810 start_codon:yes stop_codon:yes gene_type:complete